MSQRRKKKKPSTGKLSFNIIDWLFLLVAVAVAVFVLVTDHEHPLPYIVADIVTLIAGVFYMLLSAKGRRSGFIFSIITTVTFIYIVWHNQFYGNAVVSMCYLPFAFVGYYLWGKHSNKNHEVEARKLTPAQIALVVATTIAVTVALKYLLDIVGGASTFLDSITVTTTVVANILMFARYREQWLAWLLVDALQLIMWGTTDDILMMTLRILYPLAAIYGYVYWRRLVKRPRKKR